ncbi:hypothetical protein AGDE_12526 [Angomonas deanei]|uniref:Uncharacterized protein n=1 Tax=Angomonas deanei TaxID=59799 RepID=A0A7G2CE40_9TRYP|nr:hypothetical protein AGDE_12526 [Angomonas deanei]CAD2217144.1 hypothetical protein ADEAN_000462200 [Angomonas deanei]|eukprot:EPY24072.1 hypothetical protein AGDE_12526 [Angomonas deanei]
MPFVEEAVLLVKDQKLSLDGNSSLHNLLHLIKTEIEINTGKQCTVDLFASLSVSPQPFSMELAATTDKKKVQLESQTGTTLFDVLTKISDNVTAETGMKLQTDVSSDGDSVRYFSALCTDVFGVSPLLESSLNDGVWYTRVSVVVNSTYCYALSYASDARKKDSQARAANMALSFYFRKSLDLFRIKDCDTASVLNYFFIASETGKQVSEKDATSPESTDTPNE